MTALASVNEAERASDFASLVETLLNSQKVPLKKGTRQGIGFQCIQSPNKTDPTHLAPVTAGLGYRYW